MKNKLITIGLLISTLYTVVLEYAGIEPSRLTNIIDGIAILIFVALASIALWGKNN